LIEELDRDRFEAIAICVKPGPDDATSQRIRARADRWIELDGAVDGAGSLDEARRRLEELQLDVLFYQDIGMEPFTYFLAFSRLAPVQCVSFGHPNTAGIPEIDYFVSNDEYETEESPGHYSERLFLLRNLPTLAYYYRPARPLAPLDRSEIGLPGDATLYLCPQTLFKLHPDQDRLFAGILGRDPRAHLVLIAGAISQWTRELKARMRSAMPELMERVSFLPLMSHARFLRLLAAGDVMLDPVHFNGQNSSLEAFAVDLPIVTLPGRFQRGRHTLAMYRAMGIDDGVARDEADYIDLAVALGTDPARRARVRERIHAASPVLYENRRVIREFERFFTEATAALRQQD
jgi:predicted O-linked N-acetylglucosamine transferase (SPINDLY family)